jgi:UDP-4-amino-4,6-dideoxy-N-acetyl-beta-L-altrosamine N-acetyltransferase
MELDDGELVRAWRFDPENYGYFYEFSPNSRLANEAWLKDALLRRSEMNFIIESDSSPAGMVALVDIDHRNRKAELGRVFVAPAARKGGVGSAACSLVLEYAFDHLNMHKVYLEVFADNVEARALYEKLGFQRAGLRRGHVFKDGGYRDVVMMEKTID